MVGVIFASLKLDILVMLVFVGALWGAIVFPVIVSFYWVIRPHHNMRAGFGRPRAMFLA